LIFYALNSTSGLEIGPAAAIHPNTPAVVAPAVALTASGVAALFYQLYPAAGIGWAIVPVHVIRGARNYLSSATPVIVPAPFTATVPVTIAITITVSIPAAAATTVDCEVSPATMIDPNTSAI
jgi:hypothetical protein